MKVRTRDCSCFLTFYDTWRAAAAIFLYFLTDLACGAQEIFVFARPTNVSDVSRSLQSWVFNHSIGCAHGCRFFSFLLNANILEFELLRTPDVLRVRLTCHVSCHVWSLFCFALFCFWSSGGWVKIRLKLPHFHASDTCVFAFCPGTVSSTPTDTRFIRLSVCTTAVSQLWYVQHRPEVHEYRTPNHSQKTSSKAGWDFERKIGELLYWS